MTSERDFLHQISNHLATAKVSTEIAIETLEEAPVPDTSQLELLKTSLGALNQMAQAIHARRQELMNSPG